MERESSILGANSAFQMVLGGRKEEQQELEDCTQRYIESPYQTSLAFPLFTPGISQEKLALERKENRTSSGISMLQAGVMGVSPNTGAKFAAAAVEQTKTGKKSSSCSSILCRYFYYKAAQKQIIGNSRTERKKKRHMCNPIRWSHYKNKLFAQDDLNI